MKNTTPMKNKGRRWKPISSKASIKLMPYPSLETSNKPPKDTAEEPSAQTVTNWDIGRKTAISTNAHTATSTNPTTRNTSAFFDPLDLTVNPKPLLNKSHHLHHPSQFASPIKEGSKKQKTRITPHLPDHLIIIKRRNQKEQREGKEKELLYPRTKEGRKRNRQSLR